MKQLNQTIAKFLPYLLVLFAIAFNFYTLFPELSTRADPNDNIFQYSLVVRMNDIWENKVFNPNFKFSILNFKFLIDHWVPYWASGYPLPYYYQHLPHLFIVSVYHLLFETISLYSVFKLVKFFLWVALPVSFYLSGRMFGFSQLASSLSAFFGSQILTDGLFGTDISSFSFRGYGLTTQLFALFFAPMALGKIYQVINSVNNQQPTINNYNYLWAILLLAATFASHMAIGYMVALSALFIPLTLAHLPNNLSIQQFNNFIKGWLEESKGKVRSSLGNLRGLPSAPSITLRINPLRAGKSAITPLITNYKLLITILVSCFLLLSYWFIPLLLGNIYHNISFWDPPVKWNSYGIKEVIKMFLNGALFDFGRLPILTLFVIFGWGFSLYHFKGKYRFLSIIFLFWSVLFFGRATWGNLMNLLPMMKEMHQQRLINGLQLVSIFLIGIGAEFILEKLKKPLFKLGILVFLGILVYKANFNYLKLNTGWLKQANQEYERLAPDLEKIAEKIRELPPGRIFAGRPGNWGRDFKIGATQIYLALSTQGLNLNGFLPESWSLNTDLETFFNEYRLEDYQLYNIRYLVTPLNFKLPEFAQEITISGPFKLSKIETSGYFDLGTSNLLVKSQKENILNMIHLWFTSDLVAKKEFPTLSLTNKVPNLPYTTKISLKGTNLYERDGKIYSLYSLAYPLAPNKGRSSVGGQGEVGGKIISEKITNEVYQINVEMDENCSNCLIVFKMSYHPNWEAKLDGQTTEKLMVFPSFMAVKVSPGPHSLSFEYQPNPLKFYLLILGILSLFGLPFLLKTMAVAKQNDRFSKS